MLGLEEEPATEPSIAIESPIAPIARPATEAPIVTESARNDPLVKNGVPPNEYLGEFALDPSLAVFV